MVIETTKFVLYFVYFSLGDNNCRKTYAVRINIPEMQILELQKFVYIRKHCRKGKQCNYNCPICIPSVDLLKTSAP